MQSETTYKLGQADFEAAMASFISKQGEKMFDRFYTVFIDAKTVAKIHGVSPQTISRYITDGVLSPEQSVGRVHRFRLSEVLKLDISTIKHKRHYERNGNKRHLESNTR